MNTLDDHETHIESLGNAIFQAVKDWHTKHLPGRDLNGYYVACAMGSVWCAIVGALSPTLIRECAKEFIERASTKLNPVVTQADESGPRN